MIVIRIGLAVLAVNEGVVGFWNQFYSKCFYDNFPTVGLTPPFSERYAGDFGRATLGIATLLIVALVRPASIIVFLASMAYSIFSIPHLLFHLGHLEGTTPLEAVNLTAADATVALIGVLLVMSSGVLMRRDRDRSVTDEVDQPACHL